VAWDRQIVTNQEQLPPSPFRDRAVSYLEVPATDSIQSSKFYRQVFGWVVTGDGEQGRFTDGSGRVLAYAKSLMDRLCSFTSWPSNALWASERGWLVA
jgi:hypothetical protein